MIEGSVVVARLDSSCVFYDLHIQSAAWSAAGVGGRNALSQGEMGNTRIRTHIH